MGSLPGGAVDGWRPIACGVRGNVERGGEREKERKREREREREMEIAKKEDERGRGREEERDRCLEERTNWNHTRHTVTSPRRVWGRQTNKKPSAEACADACRRHEPPGDSGGPYGRLPCNAFTFCPVQFDECFEADAHTHHGGDCWLKFTEVPEAPQVSGLSSLVLTAEGEGSNC
jgi:hypothetical protein